MYYLTLPSNSSKNFYPANNASHFITKLPGVQELSEGVEVGLAEIQFTNNYFNVRENKVYFEVANVQKNDADSDFVPTEPRKFVLNAGIYESKKYFVSILNKMIDKVGPMDNGKKIAKFYYNQATKRATLTIYDPSSVLTLSPELSGILQLPLTLQGPGSFMGENIMDLDQSLKSVFVYTDIVQPRPVGDRVVPLLRTLPPMDTQTETVHHLFEKPHYIPLSRFSFDTVEIYLTNDRGENISFVNGHTIVTLHFRRRRYL